jgi:hypothetical protein
MRFSPESQSYTLKSSRKKPENLKFGIWAQKLSEELNKIGLKYIFGMIQTKIVWAGYYEKIK